MDINMLYNNCKKDTNGNFIWDPVVWTKDSDGMWQSNRQIPKEYFSSKKWKVRKDFRKKVGIMMIRDNKEVFVIQSYNNCFGFPKGEKELMESESECAVREFKEETGFDLKAIVDIKNCNYITYTIQNIVYMFYIVKVSSDFDIFTKPIDDVEITKFGWISFDKLQELKLSKAGRMIFKKYRNKNSA